MKNSLLVFGTKNFNNSFIEIKEYFDFSLIFFDLNNFSESSLHNIQFIIVDSDICDNANVLSLLNKINNKPLLLVQKSNSISVKNLVYDEKIILPLTFSDFLSPHLGCGHVVLRLLRTPFEISKHSGLSIMQ